MNRRRRDVNAWNPFTSIRDQFSCARRARRDCIATSRRVGYKLDTRDTRIDHIVDFRSTRNRRESKSETHRRNHARYESAIPSAASFYDLVPRLSFFSPISSLLPAGLFPYVREGKEKRGGKKKLTCVVISEIIPRYRVAMTDSQ